FTVEVLNVLVINADTQFRLEHVEHAKTALRLLGSDKDGVKRARLAPQAEGIRSRRRQSDVQRVITERAFFILVQPLGLSRRTENEQTSRNCDHQSLQLGSSTINRVSVAPIRVIKRQLPHHRPL